MRKLGKIGVVLVAALMMVGALGMPVAAPAPVVFSPTPILGWSTNGQVRAVLIVGNTVYAGGSFTQVQGPGGSPTIARTNLAAFDVHTGAIRSGFSADTNARVQALASDGSHLFVGGDFTTINGVSKVRLASIDPTTGAVNAAFTAGATSWVYALRVSGTRLYVGGAFGTLGGVTRSKIGAVDTTTGAVDPNFNPNANDAVHGIVVSPDGATVYAGGDFTIIGGASRNYLAPLSPATGAVLPLLFQYPLVTGSTGGMWDLDISPSGDRIFGALGGYENQVASWSTVTGQKLWFYQVDGDTQSVRYYNGNVYFGFHEGALTDHTVRMLVADATTGALVQSYHVPIDSFFGVWDIDASPDALVIGGEFLNVNNVATQGVAILPPQTTDPIPPTPPTNLRVSATSTSSITLAWDPGTDNNAVAGYRVLRNGVEVAYPVGTTFTDSPLPAATDYTYSVQTIDAAGNLSTATTPLPAGTDQTLVGQGSVWKYLDNGSNQGTAWLAGAFNDAAWASGPAQLGYGDGDEATVVGFGPDPNHKYVTTYFRRQFTVADPSLVSALNLSLLRDDGAIVYLNGVEVVRSNMPAGTVTSTTFAVNAVEGAAESQWFPFSVNPSLLVAGTNTLAVEVHQQWAGSSDVSFDLALGSARRQGPAAPANLHTTAVTGTSASLAWDAPGGASVITGYRVYRDGVLVGSPSGTTFTDPALTSGQTYSYTVTALDDHGIESLPTPPLGVSTPDVVAPSTPGGLATTTVTATSVGLTWNAATDNVGVTGYDVLRNGAVVATVSGTTATDTSVAPNTPYSYTVRARDAANNVSGESSPPVAVTTLLPAPTNLHSTGATDTSVSLAWDAPSGTITGYNVYRGGTLVGSPGGTTFTDTGLTSGQTSSYTVTAVGAASVESAPSAPVSVTTLDTVPPTKPTGLAAPTVASDHVVLTWSAATDNVGVTGYDVLRNSSVIGTTPGTTTFTDSTVTPGQTYSYAVRARDAAGNTTASDPLPVTTPAFVGQAYEDTFDSGGFAAGKWTTANATAVPGATLGTFFARLTANGTSAAYLNWPTSILQQTHRFWTFRGYFRVDSHAANQGVNLVEIKETGGTAQGYLWADRTTGRCTLDLVSTNVATTPFSCADGAWHLVEMRGDFSSSTYTLDWRIDGIAQPSVSATGQSPATVRSLWLGEPTSGPTNVQDWDNVKLVIGDAAEPFLGGLTPFG